MPDYDDTPTSEGATNVSLHQRSATPPFTREVVNIQGDENVGRAIGFDAEGRLSTLLVGTDDGEPTGPIELIDMAPLPGATVIGRKSLEGGTPEAVTVPEMIALDPAGAKAALGKITLTDMANLAQARLIGRASASPGVPEAVTLAQMVALDPAAIRTAMGKIALSDMADLTRGRLIARVATSPNPGVPEAVTLPQLIGVDPAAVWIALGKVGLTDMADLPSGTIIGRTGLTTGVPEATTVAEMTALDPESVRVALNVHEDPFMVVDNEIELNTALMAGRSIVLRGEGTGGVIAVVAAKNITARFTEIKSDVGAVLQFAMPQPGGTNPRGFTVHADDVTFRNFELCSDPVTRPVASNSCFGIGFCDDPAHNHGHRMRVIDMHIHNWCRCISKVDKLESELNDPTTTHLDCEITRLYAHTFRDRGLQLDFGLHRLVMRDSRVIGRLAGEVHTTNNALHGGIRWEDNTFVNCVFSDVDMMGFEATLGGYGNYHRRTRLYGCRAENCGSMGFSTMFGTGIVLDKCVAKNVKWIGFEIGGSNPERGESSHRYGQGIIDGCEVDGVVSKGMALLDGSGQAIGISMDCARDTVVSGGTRISNVYSAHFVGEGQSGVTVNNSERCAIRGCSFLDCGIYMANDSAPNNRGFHEISGNSFRNLTTSFAKNAVYVINTSCEVRNNVAWEKSSIRLSFGCDTAAPAKVTCEGVQEAHGPHYFNGTNVQLTAGTSDYPPDSGA